MQKKKNKKTSKKNQHKRKIIISLIIAIILVIISIAVFTIPNFAKKNSNPIEQNNYIVGNIYTPNASANMLDYLYHGENVLMSPLNANAALALFYNGADNSTKKELKKYFANDLNQTNEINSGKLNRLQTSKSNVKKDKYEEYLKIFIERKYPELRVKDINKLSQKEREELISIIRKIEMYYNQKQTKIKEKEIENYQLSDKEKKYNGYTIKEKIDYIMVNYEIYQIENKIINYNEVYYQANKKTKITDRYTKILKNSYNTKITPIDYKNKETNSIINDNLQSNTNNQIPRVVGENELSNNSLLSINSLLFNYEWENAFASENIKDEEFIDLNEKYYMVDMMYDEENAYIENEKAIGFIKDFEGKKYSFVGILPKEKGEYQVGVLDIESLLSSKKETKTYIGMPIFNLESLNNLSELYTKYNIKELFTTKANLHEMSNSDLYLDTMYQKETITIGKNGTVESKSKTTSLSTKALDDSSKKVVLNRPFTFLIIDNENNDILLIGRFNKPEK